MIQLKRTIVLTLIAMCIALNANATSEVYTVYNHSHIKMSLCYNYSYIPLSQLLTYKAMSEILNTYTMQKVEEGKLDGSKKINFQLGGTIFGGLPSVEMSRSTHGYHIILHEFPNLKRLMQIVDYVASPHWESLVYEREEHYESARKLFDKRLSQYAANPDMRLAEDTVTVHTNDELKIIYIDEKLYVTLNEQILPIAAPGNIYPVKFKDRYIVFGDEKIWVYEKNNLILEYRIPQNSRYEDWDHDYFSEVYNDWLNVYYNNRGHQVFSYCYSKNRLYTISQ